MDTANEKAAQQLQDVRQWAKAKIDSGSEPPWAWFQYMKLIETADAILTSMACVTTMENSQQSVLRPDASLRLVDSTFPQDIAQHHPVGLPVHLPM
jgi:hypothetical protein